DWLRFYDMRRRRFLGRYSLYYRNWSAPFTWHVVTVKRLHPAVDGFGQIGWQDESRVGRVGCPLMFICHNLNPIPARVRDSVPTNRRFARVGDRWLRRVQR